MKTSFDFQGGINDTPEDADTIWHWNAWNTGFVIITSGIPSFQTHFGIQCFNPSSNKALLTILRPDGSIYVHVPIHVDHEVFEGMKYSLQERAVIRFIMYFLREVVNGIGTKFFKEQEVMHSTEDEIDALLETSRWVEEPEIDYAL